MRVTTPALLSFWCTPWSETLRNACVWIARFGPPISGKQPDEDAPNWLRPLCLQRWVGKAIAARLAWMREHPERAAYCYGPESEPCWEPVAWVRYDWRCLRALAVETLLYIFGMEVERLLRIVQEPPALVGDADWTRAALGASEHLAQVYAELRRRQPPGKGQSKAIRARFILREELRRYVTWEREETAAAAEAIREPARSAAGG
jgi:hypothetical protein